MQALKSWIISKLAPDYDFLRSRNAQLEQYAELFPRYVDKQVVDIQCNNEITTDGEVRDICVMFTDVRGFTKFSQQVSLAEAKSFLNNFYDIVVYHTQAHGGIIDKFMGDGTMSIFGAIDPRSQTYVQDCILAGIDILHDFRQMTMQKSEPSLFLGVGVAQGPAIVGTFGNGEFVNFTAIGHTVNLAARVQSKVTDNSIFVTKEVSQFLAPHEYRSRGRFELKNVLSKVELFQITA